MNLQQLNNQGQQIRVFVITTIVALLLTILIWFSVELRQTDLHMRWLRLKHTNNHHHHHQASSTPKNNTKIPGLMTRISLLKFLCRRHAGWMWATNAWLCILTNDRWGRIYFDDRDIYIGTPEVRDFNQMTVCEYVTLHADKTHCSWYDPRIFFAKRSSSSPFLPSSSTSTSKKNNVFSSSYYPGLIEHEINNGRASENGSSLVE